MGAKVKEDLKIIELRGENFKKIKAIVIRPDDNLVLLTGKNAMGKSSAIDLIIAMLSRDRKWIPQPIRKGQTHADGRLDLGEFIVICKWTEKGKYLKVTSREGLVYTSPQALLDGFVGKLGFDIGKFFNMEEKEQTEVLMDLAKLDFTEVDREIERLVEERRLQGQKVKLYEGERDTRDFSGIPNKAIDVSILQRDIEESVDHNRDIDASKRKVENLEESMSNSEARITDLEEEIKILKSGIDKAEAEKKFELNYLESVTKIDVEVVRDRLNKALEINELVQAKNRNIQADQKFKYELSVYEKQTAKITGLRKSKDSALREAKFPLPGLKVTTTGTFFNDIPIKQLSSSENMKVAMSIAMALNEKFKVILVKEASLLDKENLKVIREMAKDGGYQVWLEMVSDTGEMGFYFVEGEIAKVNGEPTDKESIYGRVVDAEFEEGEVKDEN